MIRMRPSVVCFDLGGVVVRICRSWAEGCAAAGLDARCDFSWEDAFASRQEVGHLYSIGAISSEEWAVRLAKVMRNLYTPEEIWCVNQSWILGEYPGVADLIGRINERGTATACLSNTNDGHWRLMLRGYLGEGGTPGEVQYPSIHQIQRLHASHLIGAAKPDEAIYRSFETSMQVKGEEILFFDDMHENVATARRLGWNAELIDHAGDTADQMLRHLRRHGVPEF